MKSYSIKIVADNPFFFGYDPEICWKYESLEKAKADFEKLNFLETHNGFRKVCLFENDNGKSVAIDTFTF